MRWRVEIVALTIFAGCATAPLPTPEMGGDWKVRQGQAVWKPRGGAGVAGELLVATNTTGDFIIEFAKPPITIAHAQRSGDRWQIDFPAQQKTYGGRGGAPTRLIWLHVAPALAGRDERWQMTTNSIGWQIRNARGETLEGFLAP
jgi:hypothetical protein